MRSIRSRTGTTPDVIGIDTGITMLMAENLRTGFVWETFMKNPEAQRGMQRAGFMNYLRLDVSQGATNQRPECSTRAGPNSEISCSGVK